jgi:hypothetical protein
MGAQGAKGETGDEGRTMRVSKIDDLYDDTLANLTVVAASRTPSNPYTFVVRDDLRLSPNTGNLTGHVIYYENATGEWIAGERFTGIEGETGDVGDRGSQGPEGPPGAMGEQGAVGETGAMGDQGETGDPGDPGDVGDVGLPASNVTYLQGTPDQIHVDGHTDNFTLNTPQSTSRTASLRCATMNVTSGDMVLGHSTLRSLDTSNRILRIVDHGVDNDVCLTHGNFSFAQMANFTSGLRLGAGSTSTLSVHEIYEYGATLVSAGATTRSVLIRARRIGRMVTILFPTFEAAMPTTVGYTGDTRTNSPLIARMRPTRQSTSFLGIMMRNNGIIVAGRMMITSGNLYFFGPDDAKLTGPGAITIYGFSVTFLTA